MHIVHDSHHHPHPQSSQSSEGGPSSNATPQKNRLTTVFQKEPQSEVEKRKLEAQKPFKRLTEFPVESYYGELIDIPLRPPWDYSMSKEEVEANERVVFEDYLDILNEKYKDRLNHFEHNLEVWRQLWRVCEISDVLFILADSRHPLFHFPPALYRLVVKVMNKPLVLVLTKTDLVPEKQVRAWLTYFRNKFPGLMTTFVRSYDPDPNEVYVASKKRKKINKNRKNFHSGVKQFIEFINPLLVERGAVPLEYKENPGEQQPQNSSKPNEKESESDSEMSEDAKKEEQERIKQAKEENPYEQSDQKPKGVTLGFIGHPNVGKSTLINTLKGKKVCSTSRSPGHTKYKQTVYLNDTVLLCDCPGLVFPACDVPKVLQVVCGIFPIAQLREPYSAIQYIAERVPIERVYSLEKIYKDASWSAYEICEAYAEKRGYHTIKGRPDTHRAALEMLKDHLDGRVTLYFSPKSAKINVRIYDESQQENEEDIEEEEEQQEEGENAEEEPQEQEEEPEESSEEKQGPKNVNPFALLGDE
uniref:Guanine nucleotide-binding protein-like 1 n=1 Tax=Arcella intermedia TaxID=1963864 RepID=A0A6B2L127_9EUKA